MINTKRGLSDIITNVLIILLVLVAVGIIWAFVRPAIQGGAQQVAGASDCLAVNVVPTACSNTVTGATTGADLWNVTVSMGTGSTANIEELKFIFRDSTGAVRTNTTTIIPEEFESRTFDVLGLTGFSEDTVDIAVVVSASGQLKTCEPSGTPVTCTSPA
ncbi:MAG: hypothetical protein AABW79_01580 [Nanoarchaeota archaeon]